MLEQFLTYINKENLISEGEKILLAISGGVDSCVLADLLHKAKINFGLAHCNFGLRAEESDADELFVKKLSIKYKVPFHNITFQTENYANERKISIQMAARELRYAWFAKIQEQFNYQKLGTAHHGNDSAETILLNLAKGSGLAGFHGILPKNGNIIRPLLFANKDDIFDYVVENQIIWREDSSNESTKYQRNFIRTEIVPKFQEINPNIDQTIQYAARKVRAIEKWMAFELEKFKQESVSIGPNLVKIKFDSIQNQPHALGILSQVLAEYQFNFTQIEAIAESLDKLGNEYLSANYKLTIEREYLAIEKQDSTANFGTIEIEIEKILNKELTLNNETFKFYIIDNSPELVISKNKNLAFIDKGNLGKILKFRLWKNGDWFCPLGMNQKKNISDLLTDVKIETRLRPRISLFLHENQVIWVTGVRIDNRFKVSEKTQEILVIEKVK